MKKTFYAGLVALTFLSLVSCNKEEENFITETHPIPTYNLVTAADGEGSPIVNLNSYNYTMKYPSYTVSMKASDIFLGSTKGQFATPEVPMFQRWIKMNDALEAEEITFEAKDIPENMLASDVKCILTQAAYAPGDVKVPMEVSTEQQGEYKGPYYERLTPGRKAHYTVMSYNYGPWKVRTFWPDMTFCGQTKSTFPGMTEPNVNEKMSYRVYMHRNQDNSLTGKADVIIYSASFAPGMPDITIVVKDLDLKFDNNGYEVSGTDVVPYMVEAGALQIAPRYKFNELKMNVNGDLTAMQASFTVAGSLNANFLGYSVKK